MDKEYEIVGGEVDVGVLYLGDVVKSRAPGGPSQIMTALAPSGLLG